MCIITTTMTASILGALGATLATQATATAASVMAVTANTIIGAGLVAGMAGSAIGAVSSYTQGKQQQAMYNYQAQVDRQNAKIANENAAQERQQGLEEARLQRMKTLQVVGSQQAAMAANGMDITQGTSLDIIEDTAAMGELDALQIEHNYERKALAYEQQANNFINQSNMDVISGKNAYSAGKMNAAAAGLNGLSKLSSVSSKWSGFGS